MWNIEPYPRHSHLTPLAGTERRAHADESDDIQDTVYRD